MSSHAILAFVAMLPPLDAARATLGLCRLIWFRRARDEARGVLLQGSPEQLREAARSLACAIAEAELHPEGSEAHRQALARAAEAIDGLSQALIPTDGLGGLFELGAQLVRGSRFASPKPPRRWGQ
jgi:hypothetical protein